MILAVFALLFLCVACDENPSEPDYQKEIALFGYLRGNEPLNSANAIMIAYSQPITDYYELEKAAITGANVTLTDASNNQIYKLNDTAEKPGFYFNDSLMIRVKTTYHLRVEIDDKVVTASTTVPPALTIETELSKDSVTQAYRENLGKTKPIYIDCESTDQIVLVDMFCNELWQNAEYVSPFHENHKYPDDQEEYDSGRNGEPRHIMAFARLKDFVSAVYPDQYVIFWYSSMIVFYGSYTLQVLAIDDNYHKFLYAEHPELNSGIDGGIGVFGSLVSERYELMILKP